jgi:hypothetical protein
MNHKRNILQMLLPHRLGRKMFALAVGLSTLVVALATFATISSPVPVAEAMSPITREEYYFLVDNPEMLLVPHYPAGSEAAFLAANPEMLLVPHYPVGSESALLVANPELIVAHIYNSLNAPEPVAEAKSPITREEYYFLVDNPEMLLVPHYPAGSEAAFLAANPEMLLVPHYPAGSESALLVANPELIVAHIYNSLNARTVLGLH